MNKGTIGRKVIPQKLTQSKLLDLLYSDSKFSSSEVPDSVYDIAYRPQNSSP